MSRAATPRYLDWRIWAASTVIFGALTVFVAVASPAVLADLDPTPAPVEPTTDATRTPSTTGAEPTTRTPQPTRTTGEGTPVSTTTVTEPSSVTAVETPTVTDGPETPLTETPRWANDTRSPFIGGPPAETATPAGTTTATAAETVADEAETDMRTESTTPSPSPPPTTVASAGNATERVDDASVTQTSTVTRSVVTASRPPRASAHRSFDLVTAITVLSGLFTIFSGLSSATTFVLERRRAVDPGQATLDEYAR